jgi:glycosyltransferase involved in cell wall biosynthesis
VPEEKVHVTWLDCPTYFTPEKALEHEELVKKEFGLPKSFIVYPANLWAHKNHLTLIKALERYDEFYGDPPTLVLTGYKSDAHQQVLEAIKGSRVADKIRFLGYVSGEMMPAIYGSAKCLVFPSMFEGFGIPLIEAMRTGCPIIAANNTTMREIVLIRFVMEKPELRGFLIENGLRRAELFSFERCVQQTLRVVDEIYRRSLAAN